MALGAEVHADASSAIDPEERIDLLLRHLDTRRDGLRSREAAHRLEQFGPNEITRKAGPGRFRELGRQFTHPLALLLGAAAVLALVGGIPALAVAIVVVIVLNAVFAFAQEMQAERATEALQQFLPPLARVRRDGRVQEVEVSALVPGDVLRLEEGDRLSADARLVHGSVELDMSPLTGESQPVGRGAERGTAGPAGSLLEADDLVFGGSLCTGGDAEAVVYATGMHTQLGRIAALSQRVKDEVSPLERQVKSAAQLIAMVAVAAGVVFLLIGIFVAGLQVSDAVTFAIGLLVANVPEGLLPTITLALAVGVRRMAKRKALVKRLAAVETLGSTDVICTDKTGTLTEGRMVARALWADGEELLPAADGRERASREPFSALLRTAVRCSNAGVERRADGWVRKGDPSESALLVAAAVLGEDVEAAQDERERRRLRAYHFDARLKRMTTFDEEPGGGRFYHAKGAPVELLARCSHVRGRDGSDRPLTEADRELVAATFERYARRGLRVLGYAERRMGEDATPDEDRDRAEAGLVFVGLAALEDPPRADVREAVERCHGAGVRIIVISGDHGLTAEAVAREVGIVGAGARVVTGPEIDAMGDDDLDGLLDGDRELIIARSNPETKLRVVQALRAVGHTVAMTGDGVNDAPALRQADLGIAMGASGTDVAREAATMILTDDSFASIVAAIEEGRVVYENTRKFITYIFAHAPPEIIPFLLFALSGGSIPLPLTALQILAIDLGTDILPALALGREPAEPGILDRPPRPRSQRILDRAMLTRAWLWIGLLEAALVTGGFLFVLLDAGWSPGDPTGAGTPLHSTYLAATAMTFAGITACQIGTAFATRTNRASLRSIGFFSNRPLLWGILFEVAFAAAVIYLPPLQDLFATAALGTRELLLLAAFPVIVWGSDELRRWLVRRRGFVRARETTGAHG